VLNGEAITLQPGQATSVPFTIRASGGGLPLFELLGGSTGPNVEVTPSSASLAPPSGNTTVPVSVSVGANTPPGTYDVTLTARVGGVQQRTGTVKLNVVAPPQAPPAAPPQPPPPSPADVTPPDGTFALTRGQKLGKALSKGAVFKARCSEACTAVITLKKGRTTVATGKGSRTSAGSFNVRAKFTRAAKKKYKRSRSLKLSVQLVVTDTAGLTDRTPGTITLKR
jgi:hypothetical protein